MYACAPAAIASGIIEPPEPPHIAMRVMTAPCGGVVHRHTGEPHAFFTLSASMAAVSGVAAVVRAPAPAWGMSALMGQSGPV